jgi:protein ImuB
MSRIVSVWLRAWPIARLLRAQVQPLACAAPADAIDPPIDPGRPLVLVAPGKGGPRIVALNRAARQGGLVAGDLLSNARSKVLDLQTRAADPAADAAALDKLALWAMRYTPLAAPWDEASGADGLFIDITGSAHLCGGEARLLADLDRRLRAFGLAPRLAVAGTPGAAWALARHGPLDINGTDGRTVGPIIASGAEAAALRPLPLAALRLPEATLSLLRRLGLRRIGDVMEQPRAPLAARFEALLLRLDQALGRAPEPLVPPACAGLPGAGRIRGAARQPRARAGGRHAAPAQPRRRPRTRCRWRALPAPHAVPGGWWGAVGGAGACRSQPRCPAHRAPHCPAARARGRHLRR